MRVALCQFGAGDDPVANAAEIDRFAEQAAEQGAKILVAPEAALVRLPEAHQPVAPHAQPLDGQFARDLAKSSAAHGITIVAGSFTPGDDERAVNTLVVLADGELVAHYDKLHLYDAFAYQESKNVRPGDNAPVTIDVDGIRFGLATCYDLRFPEIFRALIDNGAQAFLLPAAWVRGPVKEEHWFTLLRARAIENTAYLLASGEAGERCIGRSTAFDPLGLQLTDLGAGPGVGVVDVDPARVAAVRETVPSLSHRRFRVVAG
ncbi:putative amidohydrolase [Tamaricihabitans halophyticus]|uniref:Putative amidohydrolase n=1 Tax=Tamaricihabitans halophyticus TaxID=1262583 RepID=A0A4R2QSY7_9PSEU|nr:carbon-nitrogen hydrolase family protein [Tamaricihabitans halophyticus]TCP53022.1 putative amidohydrolase [Tamaricihabitans halophyticus]